MASDLDRELDLRRANSSVEQKLELDPGVVYSVKPIDVVDGDTVDVAVMYPPWSSEQRLVRVRARLSGVDTPELRPRRSRGGSEAQRALEARCARAARTAATVALAGGDISAPGGDLPRTRDQIRAALEKSSTLFNGVVSSVDVYGRYVMSLRRELNATRTVSHQLIDTGFAREYMRGEIDGGRPGGDSGRVARLPRWTPAQLARAAAARNALKSGAKRAK